MKRLLLLFASLLCCVVLVNAQEKDEDITHPQNNHYQDEISSVQVEKDESTFWEKFDLDQDRTYNVRWMIFVIFGLSIILWPIRTRIRHGDKALMDIDYWFHLVLFTITSILGCIYFLLMGSDSTWFCMPGEVGWIKAAIGFIGLGWVAYNQFFCFINTMSDIKYHAGDFDLRIGVYSCPVAIIALLITSIADWDDCHVWILAVLALCQIIQIVKICAGVGSNKGGIYAVLVIFVYLFGVISILLLLLQFIGLLIIVLVVGFFIIGIGSSSGSSSSSSSSSNSSPSKEGHGYLDPVGSLGRIEGRFLDEDTFQEYGGNIYRKQWDGSWKKE